MKCKHCNSEKMWLTDITTRLTDRYDKYYNYSGKVYECQNCGDLEK